MTWGLHKKFYLSNSSDCNELKKVSHHHCALYGNIYMRKTVWKTTGVSAVQIRPPEATSFDSLMSGEASIAGIDITIATQ